MVMAMEVIIVRMTTRIFGMTSTLVLTIVAVVMIITETILVCPLSFYASMLVFASYNVQYPSLGIIAPIYMK